MALYDWGDGKGKVHSRPKKTSTTYDWGDGKGKVHTRPKGEQYRDTSKGGGKGAKKAEPSIFDLAMQMAETAYKPALIQAKAETRDAKAQIKPGGVIDQAFDRSGAAITGAGQAAAAQTAQAIDQVGDVTKFGADAAASLGQAQTAETARQAQLYGQTADAARAASVNAASSAQQLGAQGAGMAGFLAAMQQAQGALNTSRMTANEGFRGEARTAGRAELNQRRTAVQTLKAKRASDAQSNAAQMATDIRNYNLARKQLKMKGIDSLRDFRATMAGIRQQADAVAISDENTDNALATSDANADADRASEENIAAANRAAEAALGAKNRKADWRKVLAKYDTNRNQRLDPGDAAVEVDGSGKVTVGYHYGRSGKVIQITPAQHVAQVAAHDKVYGWESRVSNALTSGKAKTRDQVRKASGMRDPQQFSLAFEMASRKQRGERYTIPRRYLPMLKAMFFDGKLPFDLSKLVVPPGK